MRAVVTIAFAFSVACSKSTPRSITNPTTSASASTPVASSSADSPIVKATSCPSGSMTYLGFHGTGTPPPALLRETLARFPDAIVTEVGPGTLGVVTKEPHSMEVRARHEAAAAAVPGWKGDVVDFPTVASDCSMAFHTPLPPPNVK